MKKPDVNPKEWYELKDAAAALCVSKSTLTRAANRVGGDRALPYKIRRSNGRRVFQGQALINFYLLTY